MAETGLSMLDLGICGFFLLFIVIGVIRGFTSDFLGLFTWVGAAVLTNRFFSLGQSLFRSWIPTEFIADVVTALVLFVISLIILVAVVKLISNGVHRSILKGLDRSLGIFSGIFRGTVLLTAIYMVGLMYWKPGQKPEWMAYSKFESYLSWSARQAQTYILPQDLLPPKIKQHLTDQLAILPEVPIADLVQGLSSPKPTLPKEHVSDREETGRDSDLEDLNPLPEKSPKD